MLAVVPVASLAAASARNVHNASLAELRRLTDFHLLPGDRDSFARATGTSIDMLLDGSQPAWRTTNTRTFQALLGIRKIVAHELNARGLADRGR